MSSWMKLFSRSAKPDSSASHKSLIEQQVILREGFGGVKQTMSGSAKSAMRKKSRMIANLPANSARVQAARRRLAQNRKP